MNPEAPKPLTNLRSGEASATVESVRDPAKGSRPQSSTIHSNRLRRCSGCRRNLNQSCSERVTNLESIGRTTRDFVG
jgi:hypothetical protein